MRSMLASTGRQKEQGGHELLHGVSIWAVEHEIYRSWGEMCGSSNMQRFGNSKSRIRVHSILITWNVHRHMSNVAWQTVWATNWELFKEDVREEATTFASVHGWWHHTAKTRPWHWVTDGTRIVTQAYPMFKKRGAKNFAEPSTVTTYLRQWLKHSQLVSQHSPWGHDRRSWKAVPEIFLKHDFQWISTADCLNPPAMSSTQILKEVTTIRWRTCRWWWSVLSY